VFRESSELDANGRTSRRGLTGRVRYRGDFALENSTHHTVDLCIKQKVFVNVNLYPVISRVSGSLLMRDVSTRLPSWIRRNELDWGRVDDGKKNERHEC
jgi:hypothetical protein